MGCGSGRCGTTNEDGSAAGCGSKGCATGGCNRLNSFDWFGDIEQVGASTFKYAEVSFKNGARKEFYFNNAPLECITGDYVVLESKQGYDIGRISMSGELVRLQMKKKNVKPSDSIPKIIRKASPDEMTKAHKSWEREKNTMLMARVITRDLNIDMKISDVEYQGDGRKATFFYTADGRVDFREVIKMFAREFMVKIDMRQIGHRNEAARIGGIGSCGRELCCSTWLTKFSPVNTIAARYQNLSINQAKLSGQCGRLKCCLNYELDSYLDALQDFPQKADYLATKEGNYRRIKTDIFKRLMWYVLPNSQPVVISLERVKEVLEMNKNKQFPPELIDRSKIVYVEPEKGMLKEFEEIDLPNLPKKPKKRRNNSGGGGRERNKTTNKPQEKTAAADGTKQPSTQKPKPKPRQRPKPQAKNKPPQKTTDGKPGNPQNKAEGGEKPANKRPQSRNNRNRNNRRRGDNNKPNGENNKPNNKPNNHSKSDKPTGGSGDNANKKPPKKED